MKFKIVENLRLPVVPLSESEIMSAVEKIRKGTKVTLGRFQYVRGISANFNGSKVAKTDMDIGENHYNQGDHLPKVLAIKCWEGQISTGTAYSNHQSTKDRRASDEWTQKHPNGEHGKSIITDWIVPNTIGITSAGNKVLQYWPNTSDHPKVKYYISIDDSDYTECQKSDIAPYMSPAAAEGFLNPTPRSEEQAVKLAKIDEIYKLHTVGNTFMRHSTTNDGIDRRNPEDLEAELESIEREIQRLKEELSREN